MALGPDAPPVRPVSAALTRNTAYEVFAQLAMTIGHAALATLLMFSDILDADVSPDQVSKSMGAMNLLAIPIGGIPISHGCDGVAGKYEFGARTGGRPSFLTCFISEQRF